MAEAHEHHPGPSRCCPEEPPQDVLEKLNKNPPKRLGYKTPNGWSGETQESFSKRLDAWLVAVAREEMAMREAKG